MDIFLIDDSPQLDFLLSEWNNYFHIRIDWIDETVFLLLCYDITENRVLRLLNPCAFLLQFLFADARIAYPITMWRGCSIITMRSYVALKIGIPACLYAARSITVTGFFLLRNNVPRAYCFAESAWEKPFADAFARACIASTAFDRQENIGRIGGMHRNAILKHAEFRRGVHARSVRRDAKMR